MKKNIIFRLFAPAVLCAIFLVCSVQPVRAEQAEAAISPALFQRMMRIVGFNVETYHGPDKDYPYMVSVQGPKNISFTLGFPSGGIKRHVPFYLENDTTAAIVELTDAGTLAVLDGDARVVATGILSAIACILTTILNMVVDILEAVFTLNILGILAAVLDGVVSLLYCILQIII